MTTPAMRKIRDHQTQFLGANCFIGNHGMCAGCTCDCHQEGPVKKRPPECCGVCPETTTGYDCTCAGNPRCEGPNNE